MKTDSLGGAQGTRVHLASHPIAVNCVQSAASFGRCAAQIVVFEDGRSFIVASSGPEVMQPRLMTAAEQRLDDSGPGAVVSDDDSSFAIRDGSGAIVGALSLLNPENLQNPDGFHALARVVSDLLATTSRAAESVEIERIILDSLRDAVVVLDNDLNVTWVSRAVGSLFGRSPSDVIGRSAVDFIHPDDVETAHNAITRLSTGLEIYRVFVRIERGDGGYEHVEVTGVDQSANSTVQGVVLSLRGTEVAVELEASADRSRRMNTAILDGLQDGIVATDQFGAITMVNGVARAMFGLDPQAPPSSLNMADFALLDNEGRTLPTDQHPTSATAVDGQQQLSVVSARSGARHVTTQRRSVIDRDGLPLGSVVTFHDVTDARRAAEELRNQALHDQLTGLANRRQLEVRLNQLLASAAPSTVAACFVDIDGFKLVNDTHGHRTGDRLIRIAAQRLASELREDDLLVRQGGDEFVALLVGVASAEEAVAAAERMRITLQKPYILDQTRFDLTASIGVALSQTEHLDDDNLLRHADIALYAAKARGRNRVESFDNDLSIAVELEERQRNLLRGALENDRLVMHFQPLVHTASGETVGYEALARCRDEHGTLVGPSMFMDSITNSGLMWDLDRAAFKLSCEAANVLARVTPDEPPVIACNFSAISLMQPNLVEFVVETAEIAGVVPSQICIEITESSAFEAGPASLVTIQALDDQGFLLALDDFGTGYSSLAHLRDLPLSSVKVDRSFIANLTSQTSERAIAEAIVNLATGLGLGVVAEGVETPEQLSEAQDMGFSTIQGWHYSPALALTEVLSDWLNPSAHS